MQYRAYRRTYINTDGVTGVDARTDIQTDRRAAGRAGRQAERYIQSGFLGHLNDAQQFALMGQLGTDLEFPDNCYSPFHSSLPFEHLHHTRRPCVPKI